MLRGNRVTDLELLADRARIAAKAIVLSGGELRADIVLEAAGVGASPVETVLPCSRSRRDPADSAAGGTRDVHGLRPAHQVGRPGTGDAGIQDLRAPPAVAAGDDAPPPQAPSRRREQEGVRRERC